jgi:hypothetical protein
LRHEPQRHQKPEARSQKPEARSQKPEARRFWTLDPLCQLPNRHFSLFFPFYSADFSFSSDSAFLSPALGLLSPALRTVSPTVKPLSPSITFFGRTPIALFYSGFSARLTRLKDARKGYVYGGGSFYWHIRAVGAF